eukprot:gene11661-24424_t
MGISTDPAASTFFSNQAAVLAVDTWKVEKTVNLLEDGCSVPFIARYRRVDTGDLSAEIVFALQRSVDLFTALIKTRENRLKKLSEKGILDAALKFRFENCIHMEELDDLWEPYKEKKTSKAHKAKSIEGMEELSNKLLKGEISFLSENALHIPPDADLTLLEAIEAILTDHIAHDTSNVQLSRKLLRNAVGVQSAAATNITVEDRSRSKYRDYHEYNRPIDHMASHQLLAIRRGKDSGELSVKVAPSPISSTFLIRELLHQYNIPSEQIVEKSILSKPYCRVSIVGNAVIKAVRKVLAPSIGKDSWREKLEWAEEEAVAVFKRNLRHLLLTPPLGSYAPGVRVVAGLDPGHAHGHKFAAVGVGGTRILAKDKFYWNDIRSRPETISRLQKLCVSHSIDVIAIGDGVGSREAQEMVAEAVTPLPNVKFAVVSEAGASVYSASSVATEEFPSEDISFLGSMSIARRLIDPLSELVKVPPSAMGVGMYQHDIDEKTLHKRLVEVIETCVNDVGADLNTASEHILKYVSGLNAPRAKAIVEYREQHGPFAERNAILKVKGLGAVTFRNAAGFLRVSGGPEALDATCVHPEHYGVARALLKAIGHKGTITVDNMKTAFTNCNWNEILKTVKQPEELLLSIVRWLGASPGDGASDIRREKGEAPRLQSTLSAAQTVTVGEEAEGVVRNMAAFGVFLDLGGGHTGLLHRSVAGDMSRIAVGQRMRVFVKDIDEQRGRIALTLPGSAAAGSGSVSGSRSGLILGSGVGTTVRSTAIGPQRPGPGLATPVILQDLPPPKAKATKVISDDNKITTSVFSSCDDNHDNTTTTTATTMKKKKTPSSSRKRTKGEEVGEIDTTAEPAAKVPRKRKTKPSPDL